MRNRMFTFVAAVTLIAFSTGCSLAMRRVPVSYQPSQGEPSCSGPILPVIDTAVAGIVAVAETMRLAVGITALAIAAIYGVSAAGGYRNSSQCSDAWDARSEWLRTGPRGEESFVPALPASGLGGECVAHDQCGPGNGC